MSAEDGALVEPDFARAYGAKRAFGVDISQFRTEIAKLSGADDVFISKWPTATYVDSIEASHEMAKEIINRFNLGDGADIVKECTGAESCVQAGVFATKKGGTYVQAGIGKENVVFPITTACVRALSIKGSIHYLTTGYFPSAIELIASGKINPRALITHRFDLADAREAFEHVKKGHDDTLKVMINGLSESEFLRWTRNGFHSLGSP
ncbi:hypothetical protein M426DRAFT_6711 [Hypoxylon sp. CI-4A]|nr:hypothetical protein M426DRAFT_6711 [Hypoxylon sp. CI-4A]